MWGVCAQAFVYALLVWSVGSALIFALLRLFGSTATYAATATVTGYCVTPLTLIVPLVELMPNSWFATVLKLGALVWASGSAGAALASEDSMESKRILILGPLLLLYEYLFQLREGV